jgi:ectoine hydroxylase-related dioxygenase (phytanoyl-CoA dioxygenase family)
VRAMKITDEERDAGRLDHETVARAKAAFEEDGFFFLEAIVPRAPLAACQGAIRAHVAGEHHMETFDGHEGIGPTFFSFDGPFAAPEIVASPILLQTLHALLGPDVSCAIYNTNLSLSGAELDQPVHVDIPSRYTEGSTWSPHVSVHLTLCDFTLDNGCTELWPGTHRLATQRFQDLEARAAERPSVRAVLPAGSFIFRDASVWHRGRVNHTLEHREMLSLFVTPRVSRGQAAVYIRPLVIPRPIFDALPPAAQAMWDVNEISG